MKKKTQTESPGFNPDEFMKLWQAKLAEMMKEKGWPEGMQIPNMGQMPFLMPFMPNFSGFGTSVDPRIEELEKRISALENKLVQRTKPAAKKSSRKG